MRTLKTAAGEADTVALDVMRAAFNLPAVQEQVPSSVSATGEGLNYIPAHELVAGSHDRAYSRFGFPKLNVLINNAGIMKAENPVTQPENLADAEASTIRSNGAQRMGSKVSD